MIAANDTKTPDLIEMDLAGERPAPVDKNKLRIAKWRESNGVAPLTVNIPVDVLAAFGAYVIEKGKGRTKSEIIAHLIQTQLLRKR